MDGEFWQARWARNEIGFHQREINPFLRRHFPTLGLGPGTRVLVPLCGKSMDMAWLAAQGWRVLGIELAEKAVAAYFVEQGLEADVSQQGAFRVYRSGSVEIRCGDFFALTARDVADCRAFYDRAAIVALPAQMRTDYAGHLMRILPGGCCGLMITFDYDQVLKAGPPFAVGDEEVRGLFDEGWQLECLERYDLLAATPKLIELGHQRFEEGVYRLVRLR